MSTIFRSAIVVALFTIIVSSASTTGMIFVIALALLSLYIVLANAEGLARERAERRAAMRRHPSARQVDAEIEKMPYVTPTLKPGDIVPADGQVYRLPRKSATLTGKTNPGDGD